MSEDFNLIILKYLVVPAKIHLKKELGAGEGQGRLSQEQGRGERIL